MRRKTIYTLRKPSTAPPMRAHTMGSRNNSKAAQKSASVGASGDIHHALSELLPEYRMRQNRLSVAVNDNIIAEQQYLICVSCNHRQSVADGYDRHISIPPNACQAL